MTVDRLPSSIADLERTPEDGEAVVPAGKANGNATQHEQKPAPNPDETAAADDSWQQSGFGSFP